MDFLNESLKCISVFETKVKDLNYKESYLLSSQEHLSQLEHQYSLAERSRVAFEQIRPLLTAASVKQLEELSNTAIQTIFGIDGSVEYDTESKRFILRYPDKVVDLVDSSGGGIVTVLSFIFDLFLLVRESGRRVLVYDEAWYAVSSEYYDEFIKFVRKACKDLNVDLLCVSHDSRLTPDMVDHVYKISEGQSIKLK
jgi:hypothetical protein